MAFSVCFLLEHGGKNACLLMCWTISHPRLQLEGKTFRQRQFWHNNNGPMPSNFREANPAHNVCTEPSRARMPLFHRSLVEA